MVLSRPHGGEGAEGEGALDLAHVVVEDGARAEGLREVEAAEEEERKNQKTIIDLSWFSLTSFLSLATGRAVPPWCRCT